MTSKTIEKTEARQAKPNRHLRYILGISLTLAIAALFGFLFAA